MLNGILIHQLPKFWIAGGRVVNGFKMVGDKFLPKTISFFISNGSVDRQPIKMELVIIKKTNSLSTFLSLFAELVLKP